MGFLAFLRLQPARVGSVRDKDAARSPALIPVSTHLAIAPCLAIKLQLSGQGGCTAPE